MIFIHGNTSAFVFRDNYKIMEFKPFLCKLSVSNILGDVTDGRPIYFSVYIPALTKSQIIQSYKQHIQRVFPRTENVIVPRIKLGNCD